MLKSKKAQASVKRKAEIFTFLSKEENEWLQSQEFFIFPKKMWRLFYSSSVKHFTKAWLQFLDQIEYQAVKFDYKQEKEGKAAIGFYQFIKQISIKTGQYLAQNDPLKLALQRRLIAFQYRIEPVNGGLAAAQSPDLAYSDALFEKARKWKTLEGKNPNYFEKRENDFLLDALCYPLFIDLLNQDPELQRKFFQWTLTTCNHPASLIEYPAVTSRIRRAYYLSSHIGTVGSQLLKIQKLQAPDDSPAWFEKMLTLPFEGKYVSLLNENQLIDLGFGYQLTVKQFFQDFRKKQYKRSSTELFATGVLNWSSKEIGRWDEEGKTIRHISLKERDWWEELPLLGVKTKEEIEQKYHITQSGLILNDHEWIVAPHSMTDVTGLSLISLHAYLVVVIPIREGLYAEYPFGKTPKINARQVANLTLLGQHFTGTITYPDEFYFHRDSHHSRIAYIVSPEMGRQFMDYIAQYIAIVWEGKSNYQYIIENCAEWTQNLLDKAFGKENIHNLFLMSF